MRFDFGGVIETFDFVVGGERERGKAWEGKGKPRDEKYERFCQFLLIIFYEKMNFL